MFTLPAPYPAAMRSAFGWTVTAQVVGAEDLPVPVLDGEVTCDIGAAVTRSLSLDVGGEDFGIPLARDVLDALLDLGGRLTVTAVLTVPGADPVPVPLGMFQTQRAEWSGSRRRGFQLGGLSLGSLIGDDRFGAPRELDAGSGLEQLRTLVGEALPGATVVLGPGVTDRTVPAAVIEEDRLGHCRDLAVALGGQLFERADSVFEVRDLTGDTGSIDGVTLARTQGWDRERVFNGVRAASSHEDYPAAVAWARDLDPASPTFWDGPFGHRPRFYSSPLLTTVQQAEEAAATILARYRGRMFSLESETVQNPAIEPGDLIAATIDGIEQTYRVQSVKLPLAVGGVMALGVAEVAA